MFFILTRIILKEALIKAVGIVSDPRKSFAVAAKLTECRIRAGVDRGPRSQSRKQRATEMEALDLQLGDTALTQPCCLDHITDPL